MGSRRPTAVSSKFTPLTLCLPQTHRDTDRQSQYTLLTIGEKLAGLRDARHGKANSSYGFCLNRVSELPVTHILGSSVNNVRGRSYGAGVAPHDPESIGPGPGGFPSGALLALFLAVCPGPVPGMAESALQETKAVVS